MAIDKKTMNPQLFDNSPDSPLPPPMPKLKKKELQIWKVRVDRIPKILESNLIFSLLQICGPVKHEFNPIEKWDSYEFSSAESTLRALRLISKIKIDGQSFKLTISFDTETKLKRYIDKKSEELKRNGLLLVKEEKETRANNFANFGVLTEEDRKVDREVFIELTNFKVKKEQDIVKMKQKEIINRRAEEEKDRARKLEQKRMLLEQENRQWKKRKTTMNKPAH